MKINAVEFKATCLKLIDRVAETGEPIIITKRGKVLARLVPDHGKPRGFGKGRNTVEILELADHPFGSRRRDLTPLV